MILAGISATLVSTAVHGGTVLYVDDDAPPPGDGLGWATAYPSLQDALAVAAGGGVTEIHVAQGVYTPAPGGISTCCTPHGSMGCDDAGCEGLVCAAVPLCCAVGWDGACAAAAVDLCGGLCADARTATFQLLDGVALMGGFAGLGEPDPDARDIVLHETVLSGDLAGNDGPDFANNDENVYTVVTGSGTDGTAVLDGFTITAGNANGPDGGELEWIRAGGMWNLTGSPTITECTFETNYAQLFGGGMYNRTLSHPLVTDCTFIGNVADEGSGGGMCNFDNCNPTVTGCTFTGNSAREGGGLLNQNTSSPIVEDCLFIGNTAIFGAGMENTGGSSPDVTGCTFEGNMAIVSETGGGAGGGMLNFTDAHPTVTNCTFTGNTAFDWSGGMLNWTQCNPTITNCTFTNNTSETQSGAMGNFDNCSPTVTGCTFSNNVTADGGGAMYNLGFSSPTITDCEILDNEAVWGGAILNRDHSNPLFVGCLFVGNTATSGGGGVLTLIDCFADLVNCTVVSNTTNGIGGGVWVSDAYGGHSENTVSNSIVWGNVPQQVLADGGATASVTYSNVQGGYPGAGNIDADPLFADADGRLGPGSPCIDAANNPAVPVGIEVGLDGNPRFVDDPCREDTGLGDPPIVDMGAYEFQDRSCDLDGTGAVGVTDFLALLAAWGPCPQPCAPSCPADFDGNCVVGVTDFLVLLANWG
jgi:hypothetical protein